MTYQTVEITKPEISYPLPNDHQQLMNIFYEHWNVLANQAREHNKELAAKNGGEDAGKPEGLLRDPTQDEIATVMPPKVIAAVILGNMHYQVGNGGWAQYDGNGYSAAIGGVQKLFEGAEKVGIENAGKILEIIKEFRQRKAAADEGDSSERFGRFRYDDEEDEAEEESYETYDDLCTRYYDIEGEVVMQAMLDRFDEIVGYSFMADLSLKGPCF